MAESKPYSDNGYDLSRLEIRSNQGGDMVDLRSQFIEIAIYESIDDDKVVGEVLLSDGLNYSETIPIVGNETIYISYKTLGSDAKYVELVGRVTAPLGKARTENEKVEVYKLQFVSTVTFSNRLKRISSSYEGTISGMISTIFKENFGTDPLKLMSLDSTQGRHRFIIPYWSPLFSIRWMTERAYFGESSYFVFYEDVDGFHFRDVLLAAQRPPTKTYRVEPVNPYNMSDVNSFMERVQSYSVTSYFDRLDEFSSGMYSGTLHTHDITTKNLETYTVDYNDLFDSNRHLNKHPLFPRRNREFRNSTSSFRNMLPVQLGKYDKIRNNEVPSKYFLNRKSLSKQFSSFRITIVVPGNSTLRLLDTIDFVIPKIGYMNSNEEDWKDSYLSGKYIITSLKTTINKVGNYRTTIEMAKDSLVKGIPDGFEKTNSDIK
jgi:hypothetical protein